MWLHHCSCCMTVGGVLPHSQQQAFKRVVRVFIGAVRQQPGSLLIALHAVVLAQRRHCLARAARQQRWPASCCCSCCCHGGFFVSAVGVAGGFSGRLTGGGAVQQGGTGAAARAGNAVCKPASPCLLAMCPQTCRESSPCISAQMVCVCRVFCPFCVCTVAHASFHALCDSCACCGSVCLLSVYVWAWVARHRHKQHLKHGLQRRRGCACPRPSAGCVRVHGIAWGALS
jgi:hypothetical protein